MDIVEKVIDAITEVSDISVHAAGVYYEVIVDDSDLIVGRYQDRDMAKRVQWQVEQETNAKAAIIAVLDAIAEPTQPMMAALKATRALYYIGRIHNGNSNVPLSVFRFADDEPVWGPGNLNDAQKWIDAECYRAMIAALRKEIEP